MSRVRAIELTLIIIIYSIALYDSISMYNLGGANWDFIAHWLYAKSLISPAFYSALFNGQLANTILYGNQFYFENLRAPLTGIMMMPFAWIGGSWSMPLYFAFVFGLLLLSIFYISRVLCVTPLLLTMLLFTPYVALFLLLLNGTEIVSIALLLIFVALLIKRDWKSGIAVALAGLAKYPNLAFVPLILLLPKEVRAKASLSFLFTTLPWLAFNAVVFHNPVFSYIISASAFSQAGANYFPLGVITGSLWLILPDLAPALVILAVLLLSDDRPGGRIASIASKIKALPSSHRRYEYGVAATFLALGAFAWLLTSARGSLDSLPRLGYLIYSGAALLLAMAISDMANGRRVVHRKNLYRDLLAALFIVMSLMLLTWAPYGGYIFYGSSNSTLYAAGGAMAAQGISSCNMISNDWVYLIYSGYRAHFPYYYNSTIQHYPIVFFTNLGSNQSAINFANVTRRVGYPDFFIAFPRNYTC